MLNGLKSFLALDTGWTQIVYMGVIMMVCISIGITPPSWWLMITGFVATFWLKDNSVFNSLRLRQDDINYRYDNEYNEGADQITEYIKKEKDPDKRAYALGQLTILIQTQYQHRDGENRAVQYDYTRHMTEIILALSVAGLVLGLFYHSVVGTTPLQWMHLQLVDIGTYITTTLDLLH